MGKIYGYARVSTVHQSLDIQVEELERFGVDAIYMEKKSGKNTKDRPEWNALLEVLQEGDTVVACKLDRIGRSMTDLGDIIKDFTERGIEIVAIAQGIDTRQKSDDIMGGIMRQMMLMLLGAFAELERAYILERTQSGLDRAKAAGVKFGAKEKYPKQYELAIQQYLNGEGSISQIVDRFDGLTVPTFKRKLKKYREGMEGGS